MKQKRSRHLRKLLILCSLQILISSSVRADQIYKWTDEFGNTHYATKPFPNSSETAPLPTIERENIDTRIQNIKKNIPANCSEHGGTDCSKNADEDGSVICSDGFREATLSFRSSCSEAKLVMKPPAVIAENGEVLGEISELSTLGDKHPFALQFFLRNTSSIEARDVRVEFIVPGKERFEAIGPEKVEPFGAAEYILHLKTVQFSYSLENLKRYKIRAGCKNCGALIALNSKT